MNGERAWHSNDSSQKRSRGVASTLHDCSCIPDRRLSADLRRSLNGRALSSARLRSGVGGSGRISSAVKASKSPAVRAFAAAMRITSRARLPLLQSQSPGSFAYMTYAGAFAMRTFFIFFCHGIHPSLLCFPIAGSEDSSKCCGSPAASGGSAHGSADIFSRPAEIPGENPDGPQVPHLNR